MSAPGTHPNRFVHVPLFWGGSVYLNVDHIVSFEEGVAGTQDELCCVVRCTGDPLDEHDGEHWRRVDMSVAEFAAALGVAQECKPDA